MAGMEMNRISPSYPKKSGNAKLKPRVDHPRFDTGALTGKLEDVIPDLPSLTDAFSTWALIALKGLAAMGFMTAANLVILYAC
jgi:hypothetical protein